MLSLILCLVVGLCMIYHDNHKYDKINEQYMREREGTDHKREYDLFLKYWVYRVEENGKPIPRDKNRTEVWYLVEQQLKREGLRLSPDIQGYRSYRTRKFDENGYMIDK